MGIVDTVAEEMYPADICEMAVGTAGEVVMAEDMVMMIVEKIAEDTLDEVVKIWNTAAVVKKEAEVVTAERTAAAVVVTAGKIAE